MSHRATVVIVEDEAILAQLLEYDLQRLGYRVLGVHSSGEAAVEAIAQERPDLVLMDVTLQGELDGVETAQQLFTRFHVPSIFLTAHSDPKTVLRAAAAEPFAYLRKPYNEKDLELALTVTVSKLEGQARREQQRRLLERALDELPGTAVVVCDDQARVAHINTEGTELTGWPRDDALGRDFGEVCELWDVEGHRLETSITSADRAELEAAALLIKPRGDEAMIPVRLVLSRSTSFPATLVAIHRHGGLPGAVDENIVVLCGWCRLILQEGSWRRLETYLAKQGKRVSHGMCDGCLAKLTGPLFPGRS